AAAGEQLGVVAIQKALDTARDINLDLVEVAPTAKPPVCRLLDYGKYKYEQIKKERLARRSQKSTEVRELRIRPKIGQHDIESKMRLILRLLGEGSKVKVFVVFRGREHAHPELGLKVLQRIIDDLNEKVVVERGPSKEGGRMNIVLAPLPLKQTKEPKQTIKELGNAEVKNT
ncbi:MAG: translation initiation factor IF-3, partial [Dehalococcoidia bacterium]|nr:translation initiation factor IF-3 [Dehalococcoidia bacterium]